MLSKKIQKTLLALAVASSFGVVGGAQAGPIIFDPTGTPGAAGNIANVNTFDWLPGNALALGAIPTAVGGTFDLLYQANLGLLTGPGSPTVKYVNGSDGNFFTVVAGFGEKVASLAITSPTQQSATFDFNPSNTNFFRIYRNSISGDDLTGLNFTGGTEILSGLVTSANFTSNFNTTGGLQAFDQANGNDDYFPITTVVGSGATSITVDILTVNNAYFPDLTADDFISFFNTSQKLAFQETDPSRCMTNLTGTASCGTASNIGPINGVSDGNFQFQADGNQSFQKIPEPGSLALLGLGFGILGAMGRRRKS